MTLRSPVFVLACAGGVPRWHPPDGRPIGNPALDTHITWLWSPGPAASCQSFGAASVLGGNTSPGPRGAGAEGHPGPPIGRPLGAWPNCRPCGEYSPPKFIGGLSLTVTDGGRTLRRPSTPACAAWRRMLRSKAVPVSRSRLVRGCSLGFWACAPSEVIIVGRRRVFANAASNRVGR